ncbi:DUF4062 domain-containing protein [Shewanella xiamenensis]|uniref:DUF4062 domain-containing protein n=1 Tax=Shewanella xiamenensis TaxID=332186 RepID=UPI000849E3D1|nr:DUF4062 domain-containing protein [Shewanella xiamenensis]ODR84790.1 hypothetical protein ABT47_05400 [Shewanella xiamenensis]
MEKKYQVFISSTYEDLKEERDQAIKAVLEMGHIPVGMEMFSAADEEQWQLIARQIEATDYYVIIVGHRYGSETPEGISYTEKEYDYAKSCGVPTLGFIIDDKASWPSDRVDRDSNKKRKLDNLKSKVKSKLVQFWSGKEDLHGKISISLIKTMNTNPRTGWSRSDETVGVSITKELSRLSEENSILREENKKLISKQIEAADEVRDAVHILNENTRKLKIRSEATFDTAKNHTRTLLQLFLAAAPNLIAENTNEGIAKDIAYSIVYNSYYKFWPFGKVNTEHLIADFAALDLVEPSKKKHPVSDKNLYWTLTKLGVQVQKRSK